MSIFGLRRTNEKKKKKTRRKKKSLTGRDHETPGHHRLRVVELARRAEAAPEVPRETVLVGEKREGERYKRERRRKG